MPPSRLTSSAGCGRLRSSRQPTGWGGAAAVVVRERGPVDHGEAIVTVGQGVVGFEVASVAATAEVAEGLVAVRADTDGTFYARPEPGRPAFAPVGSQVSERATIGLIEVMKTFHPVRSPVAGTVERVLVGEAQGVSSGQVVAWIRPGSASEVVS